MQHTSGNSTAEWLRIGTVGRAHSIHGELKLRLEPFVEEWFEDWFDEAEAAPTLFLLLRNQYAPYTLESIRGGGARIIGLAEVHDRTAAEALAGAPVFIPADDAPRSDEVAAAPAHAFAHEVLDFELVDDRLGPVGRVSDVLANPAHPLLEVRGPRGRALVPWVAPIVREIDVAGRRILTDAPEGLLEMYFGVAWDES